MKQTIKIIVKVALLTSLIYETTSEEMHHPSLFIQKMRSPSANDMSISDLVREQADAIKKIVEAQKVEQQKKELAAAEAATVKENKGERDDQQEGEEVVEYPTVTRKDPDVKVDLETLREEKEKESIEKLRAECEHMFKHSYATTEEVSSTMATVQPFGPALKPAFLQRKQPNPTTIDSYQHETSTLVPNNYVTTYHQNEDGFTSDGDNSRKNYETRDNLQPAESQLLPQIYVKPMTNSIAGSASTHNIFNNNPEYYYPYTQNHHSQPTQYVRLEPVILQKMLVTNGQNYYYWYRALPTSNYAATANQQLLYTHNTQGDQKQMYNSDQGTFITTNGHATATASSFTGSTQNYYTTTTATPPTTTTQQPTSTFMPTQNAVSDNGGYSHQLKFVFPYTFPRQEQNVNTLSNDVHGNFDPYAYYPKYFQPSTVRVPMPYVPQFNMIKSFAIPNGAASTASGRLQK